MTPVVIFANVIGWPVIHLVLARIFLAIPDRYFAVDSLLTHNWAFEQSGYFYRRILLVENWKDRLPDGAPWLGGMSKQRLERRDAACLHSFLIETRRGEIAHWCMMLCTPVFFLWNPLWACAVMIAYGVASNLPCILAQRANRAKLTRILMRSKRRTQVEPY